MPVFESEKRHKLLSKALKLDFSFGFLSSRVSKSTDLLLLGSEGQVKVNWLPDFKGRMTQRCAWRWWQVVSRRELR